MARRRPQYYLHHHHKYTGGSINACSSSQPLICLFAGIVQVYIHNIYYIAVGQSKINNQADQSLTGQRKALFRSICGSALLIRSQLTQRNCPRLCTAATSDPVPDCCLADGPAASGQEDMLLADETEGEGH